MPWGFISEMPITADQYDVLDAELPDEPPGLILHVASKSEKGMRVIGIWQTQEDHRRFETEDLFPAMGRLGWPPPENPPQPIEFDVHNLRGSAA